MLSPQANILYIGKAKDLRNRLNSYKRAKPEQVSRKVMRMINMVAEIRWEETGTERAALLRENQLLREYKPPFNVVNTSPETYYFVGLGVSDAGFRFQLTTNPDTGDCELYGAYKGRGTTRRGYASLLRLLWAAHNKPKRFFQYPSQLVRPKPPYDFTVSLGKKLTGTERKEWVSDTRRFLAGTSRRLLERLTLQLLENEKILPFLYAFIQEDLETLEEFYEMGPLRNKRLRHSCGIREKFIAQERIDDLLVIGAK